MMTMGVHIYQNSKTNCVKGRTDIDCILAQYFQEVKNILTRYSNDRLPLKYILYKRYYVQGTLDLLAPRAYAPGTNAWTDIDHTCYSMSSIYADFILTFFSPSTALTTAGSDGFLQLLPVYADHILYPTLTDSGFYTEVHHINQNGEDAGKTLRTTQFRMTIDFFNRRKLCYCFNSKHLQ